MDQQVFGSGIDQPPDPARGHVQLTVTTLLSHFTF
jgi:hypothetical protein